MRDNMRATLDEIMAKAPAGALSAVPKYDPKYDVVKNSPSANQVIPTAEGVYLS
jgi:hypothetical protein